MRVPRDDQAPPLSRWLMELPRLAFIWSSPIRPVLIEDTSRQLSGSSPPVLVFPGIMSSDYATSLLRRTLRQAGFATYASRLGVVTGVTREIFADAERRLNDVYQRHGRKVALVGISLGGLFARVLAQRHPDKVELVLTLGTPFSGDRRANNAWRLYEAINDHSVDTPPLDDDPSVKPKAKTIAIWSPYDGIVAPACSRGSEEQRDLAIEVPERHFEFSASRRSIRRVLDILLDHTNPISD
ncbi:MAG: alpha/beta fold hydrolase [Pseudomonadota bacterium]